MNILGVPEINHNSLHTVYPQKYAHGFCFAVLCCGYTLTDFPISIRLTSLALWQSNDCPSASKATLMNMDKYFMWIHYERLHNHNKAKHNKTVCIFLGLYCTSHHHVHYSNICPVSRKTSDGKFRKKTTNTYLLCSKINQINGVGKCCISSRLSVKYIRPRKMCYSIWDACRWMWGVSDNNFV